MGELIPCGSATELDAAIGTGSTIYNDGIYYTFYTAHSPNAASTDGITEAVMLATSKDFKTWEKNRELLITGSDTYSNIDFRDPCVFKGDDGIFHMLVSTRKDGKGVLAEYTSPDLLNWESAGVFMTMMWDRFYECPDLFKMGDWWYLIYSEQHDAVRRVQYFKGRTLDELKACTANDAGLWPDSKEGFLDSRGFYAGKTASDGTNRYIWDGAPHAPAAITSAMPTGPVISWLINLSRTPTVLFPWLKSPLSHRFSSRLRLRPTLHSPATNSNLCHVSGQRTASPSNSRPLRPGISLACRSHAEAIPINSIPS